MIIIPDRPMPKTCAECPCLHQEKPLYCKARTDRLWKVPQATMGRPKWCPLKEGKRYGAIKA